LLLSSFALYASCASLHVQGLSIPLGCSVSMACKTLARLCHGPPLDDEYMQVTPPVVHSVIPLCKIGNDNTGHKLLSLLENCGVCRNVDTSYTRMARQKDPTGENMDDKERYAACLPSIILSCFSATPSKDGVGSSPYIPRRQKRLLL
jgi:hypothetical protein